VLFTSVSIGAVTSVSIGAVHCIHRGDSSLSNEVQRISPGQANLQIFGRFYCELFSIESM
jgi:hypothetical protein